jgi:hypothetical protein
MRVYIIGNDGITLCRTPADPRLPDLREHSRQAFRFAH